LDALRRALELPAGSEANAYFQARARAFMVDNERSKEIVVRFGGGDHRLPPTGPSGHTLARLVVAADALDRGATPVAAVLRRGDDRHFEGSVLRLDPGGLSVVSDIDDTIKISEVRDLQALLANTFLRPFAAVPELPVVYQRWADRGALFHYVSASPWHLYDPLREFVVAAGYPLGSFHLKDFRWKDHSFLSLVQDPESYKLAAIEPLITRATGHRFALIGDSGEADPEAYAELYRRHPDQVVHIYIRDVSGEGPEAPRYQTTFAGVPVDRWTIFTSAGELPEAPPRSAAPTDPAG
ncbi:MAG: App1 family protein, partial [Myxococcales bacterium]|nr:App1 family protein [Myxococcales bacterium]